MLAYCVNNDLTDIDRTWGKKKKDSTDHSFRSSDSTFYVHISFVSSWSTISLFILVCFSLRIPLSPWKWFNISFLTRIFFFCVSCPRGKNSSWLIRIDRLRGHWIYETAFSSLLLYFLVILLVAFFYLNLLLYKIYKLVEEFLFLYYFVLYV